MSDQNVGVPQEAGGSHEAGAPLPSPKLLELLVCPLTKTPLVLDRSSRELISKAAGLAYPIREGIPVLLASEARHLDDR